MGDNGELKKEEPKIEAEKAKVNNKAEEPPTEFKIAEIWIKNEQLVLDASPEFWMDKLRALGVLEMCKDIVKQYKKEKPRIITGNQPNSMMNFARKVFRGKR